MFHVEANYDLVLENSKLTMVELTLLLKEPMRINTKWSTCITSSL